MRAFLSTFLDAPDGAAGVIDHARLLLRLSGRFAAAVPEGLARSARVANYKSGKVVIHADSGAVAAKLRQMSGRLCSELCKGGPECTGVEIKVQPRQDLPRPRRATQKPLSRRTLGTLTEAAQRLPAGDLQNALRLLTERAAKGE